MTAYPDFKKHSLLMTSFCIFLSWNASTTNYVWDAGAGTNNWTQANNWNPNGVPGSGDQAYIATASVQIPAGSNIFLEKLTLNAGGVLTISTNASLTISGGTHDRRIQMDGSGGASLTNNGTLSLSNSTLMGIYMKNATFTNNGTATISYSGSHGGMEMRDNTNFTNNGSIDIGYVTDGDAIHQIESTAVVYNYGFMHFHHLHDGIFGYAGTKFHNYGAIDIFYHDIENIAEVLIDGEGGLDFFNYNGGIIRGDGEIGPDVLIHSGGTVDPTDDTGEGIGQINFYCNSAPCVDQNFNNSTLVVDIEGTAGGGVLGGHDKFTFSHQANFATTTVFDVNFKGTYSPQAGHFFVIMNYPSKTGTPTFSLPALPAGLSWITSVTNTQINLSISGALPVELIDFQARQRETVVFLQWETASEINNRGFFVERMAGDNSAWEEIGFTAGLGTTHAGGSYSFSDEKPLQGMNYYRLRQVDFDGKENFSLVEGVSYERQENQLWLTPNPTAGFIYFDMPEGAAQLEIIDSSGRRVLSQQITSNDDSLNISNLVPGIYLVRLETANGWSHARLVKY